MLAAEEGEWATTVAHAFFHLRRDIVVKALSLVALVTGASADCIGLSTLLVER
jgi:hypothetical protein